MVVKLNRPDGATDNIVEDLANALEKAIELIFDISIQKSAVPYDIINRWENLVKYARKINN